MTCKRRGPCTKQEYFETLAVDSEDELGAEEAPLLNFSQGDDDDKFKVQEVFSQVCLVEEFFRTSLYTSGDISVPSFVVQSLFADVMNRMSVPLSTTLWLEEFNNALQRDKLRNIFKFHGDQALRCRKNMVKDIFLDDSDKSF